MKIYITRVPEVTRDFHNLIMELAAELKLQNPDAEIIQPETPVWHFNFEIDNFPMAVRDCEILVEQDGCYKGLSFADLSTEISCFINLRNKAGDILLASQLMSQNGIFWQPGKFESINYKVHGGIYAPFFPLINYDYLRKLRKLTPKVDKFVFKGNMGENYRRSPLILKDNPHCGNLDALYMQKYFLDILQYKVALAIPGVGEMCHREIENMAIGLPFIKFEYITPLTPPLIPNVHYISIPRIDTNATLYERLGGEEYAALYLQRFLEVKDDEEFLNFISKNAMDYYDTYLHPNTRIKHIFELWEIPFKDII